MRIFLQFSIRKIYEIQQKITPDCLICDDCQTNIFAIIDLVVINECRVQRGELEDCDEDSIIPSHSPSNTTVYQVYINNI
jgi:hypothetical protein